MIAGRVIDPIEAFRAASDLLERAAACESQAAAWANTGSHIRADAAYANAAKLFALAESLLTEAVGAVKR